MHQHGGSPEKDFKRLSIEPCPVTDFSVNVSPLGVPHPIQQIWNNLLIENEYYPSMDGGGVKRFYEARFGLPPECILPGNGSIDLIYDVPRILNIKHARIPQPAFHDYARACHVIGAKEVAGSFDHLEGYDALFIGNPNNPTGTLIPAEQLLHLADRFPDTFFFIDEAFIQFVENPETFTLMHPERLRKNIVVFHSLTKTYALPGLRLGACISTPETIARLATRRAPWMVSRIAERVAEALVDCSEYEKKLFGMMHTERNRIFNAFNADPRFRPIPGTANFLLSQWTGSGNLDDLQRMLLKNGLYVRDCRNFQTLKDNWFRVAIRLPEENTRLLQALENQ